MYAHQKNMIFIFSNPLRSLRALASRLSRFELMVIHPFTTDGRHGAKP